MIPKLVRGPFGYRGEGLHLESLSKTLTADICHRHVGYIPSETYLVLGMLEDGSYITLIPSIDRGMGFSIEGSYIENAKSTEATILLNGHRSSRENIISEISTPFKAVRLCGIIDLF